MLRDGGHEVTGVDLKPSPYTTVAGSVADRAVVRGCMAGADAVLHTATLHKPHVGSHGKQAFVDANVTGTLTCSRRPSRRACAASCSPAARARSAAR